MNKLKLISPMPVSVNHYLAHRSFITYIKGKAVAQTTMYTTSEAKKYKKEFAEYLKQEIKNQGWDLVPNKTQHFYIDLTFYFPRIDMDCNNYLKLLLDAITDTQSVWLDDNCTCERVNRIYYDSKNPRIEIDIYPVDYIGIFDNNTDLQTFEIQCHTCSRYKNNCSILNKCMEGRIIEEIDIETKICSKYKQSKSK